MRVFHSPPKRQLRRYCSICRIDGIQLRGMTFGKDSEGLKYAEVSVEENPERFDKRGDYSRNIVLQKLEDFKVVSWSGQA